MKFSLVFLVTMNAAIAAPTGDRWIVETAPNIADNKSFTGLLVEACPELSVADTRKMGLENHYIVVLKEPVENLACANANAGIVRTELDRVSKTMQNSGGMMRSGVMTQKDHQ